MIQGFRGKWKDVRLQIPSLLCLISLLLITLADSAPVVSQETENPQQGRDIGEYTIEKLLLTGRYYLNLEDYETALLYFEKAYHLSPSHETAILGLQTCYRQMALSLVEKDQEKEAIPWLEKLLEVQPCPSSFNFLKDGYHQSKNYLKEWFLTVRMKNWTRAKGLDSKYFIYRDRLYDLEEEIIDFKEIVEKKSTYENLYWLGWLYARNGDFQEAINALSEAEKATTETTPVGEKNGILEWLAISYLAVNDLDSARTYIAKIGLLSLHRTLGGIIKVFLIFVSISLSLLLFPYVAWKWIQRYRLHAPNRTSLIEIFPLVRFIIMLGLLLATSAGFMALILPRDYLLTILILFRFPKYLVLNKIDTSPMLVSYVILWVIVGLSVLLFRKNGNWLKETLRPHFFQTKETWKVAFIGILLCFGIFYTYFLGWTFFIGGEIEPSSYLELLNREESKFILWGISFIVIFVGPLIEEMLFRGFIQTILQKATTPNFAVGLTATLFASWHGNPRLFLYYVGMGLVFGWQKIRNGNIAAPIITHALVNAVSVICVLFN